MPLAEQIDYTVLTQDRTGWLEQGKTNDMHAAIRTAEQLITTGKFKRVKVDKHFLDATNNRVVAATIFDRSLESRGDSTMLWLVLLAVLGGIVSFAITYIVMR